MAQKAQVVYDCSDPDSLAKFYAEALHYKLQDPPEGFKSWEEALKAWNIPEEEWNAASAIIDPEGQGPRFYFQKMDTPKLGKNRLHIDINASKGSQVSLEDRKEAVGTEVERLLKFGAKKQREWEEQGQYWVVMLDPEGNEFCVQ